MVDEFYLFVLRVFVVCVCMVFKFKCMCFLDVFWVFDGDNIGKFTYEALYGGLSWFGFSFMSV